MKIQKADPPTLLDKKLWSAKFHDFLEKCLQKNPDDRLTAAQLLEVSKLTCINNLNYWEFFIAYILKAKIIYN